MGRTRHKSLFQGHAESEQQMEIEPRDQTLPCVSAVCHTAEEQDCSLQHNLQQPPCSSFFSLTPGYSGARTAGGSTEGRIMALSQVLHWQNSSMTKTQSLAVLCITLVFLPGEKRENMGRFLSRFSCLLSSGLYCSSSCKGNIFLCFPFQLINCC